MLKPYEEKLKLIKSEVEKLGLDIVEALEVCLNPDYAIGKFQSKQTYYKI